MIAACPQCQTRFRLAREKLGPQGARIRCSQCQTVVRVQAPASAGPLTPAEARVFEEMIAAAPEQWWTVFFPIWTDVGPRPRSPR